MKGDFQKVGNDQEQIPCGMEWERIMGSDSASLKGKLFFSPYF